MACFLAPVAGDPDIDLLLDFQSITELDFPLEDVRKIVALNWDLSPAGVEPRNRVVVLIRHEVDDILLRLYKLLVKSSSVAVKTVYTLNSALHWLGREQQAVRIEELRLQLLSEDQGEV